VRKGKSAIGETQSKHSLQLNVIEGKIDKLGLGQENVQADMAMVKGRLEKVEGTLKEHTATLKEHTATLNEHSTQLSSLNAKVDLVQVGIGLIHEKLDELIARS
jgi:hypothetical protein